MHFLGGDEVILALSGHVREETKKVVMTKTTTIRDVLYS